MTEKLGRQPKKAPGKIVAWPARAAALGAIAALLVLGFFGIREFRKLAQPGVAGGVPTAATRPSVSAQHSNAPVQISNWPISRCCRITHPACAGWVKIRISLQE